MIRVVTTVSLVANLILVLYLPSAYPPDRFIGQLRAEYELTNEFWGQGAGTRTLARMLDLQAATRQISPAPPLASSPPPNSVNLAVATQMSEVNSRLFDNEYFRSTESLFALATYRFSMLMEGLPFLWVFLAAALFDGLVMRIVKSKEFLRHDPEIFALQVCAGILTACATIVAFVLPVAVPAPSFCLVPLALSVFTNRAIANFHRRG
ncbi:MAG: hypothetical protein JWN13_3503 [Betaproteobacteria bacterium]|jgi:hypothetical protein|nr:hypothetical protein [Betaproteobacteria bacterium]